VREKGRRRSSVEKIKGVFGKGEGGREWSQWREREEEGESCVAGCDTLPFTSPCTGDVFKCLPEGTEYCNKCRQDLAQTLLGLVLYGPNVCDLAYPGKRRNRRDTSPTLSSPSLLANHPHCNPPPLTKRPNPAARPSSP